MEAEGSGVQAHTWLSIEFSASLDYVRPLKKKNKGGGKTKHMVSTLINLGFITYEIGNKNVSHPGLSKYVIGL